MKNGSHNSLFYKYILVEVEQTMVIDLSYHKISILNFQNTEPYTKLIWYDNGIVTLKTEYQTKVLNTISYHTMLPLAKYIKDLFNLSINFVYTFKFEKLYDFKYINHIIYFNFSVIY